MAVNILLVDDHPVFRSGLKGLLNTVEDFIIVGEACDGNEAISFVDKLRPDIVIMDITMPNLNGIEATKQILSNIKETKVLALSIHSGKQFVTDMLKAGAKGYLLKDSAPDELISAIYKIMKGEMYLSSTITKVALEKEEPHNKEIENNILTTKLYRPEVSNDFIFRKNIIHSIHKNLSKPLTLISAPAGYGKSITASQLLNYSKTRYAWVSLDNEHNDTRIFLLYLHKAINKIYPNTLKKLETCLKSIELPTPDLLANILINELDQITDDFILVLDDYHSINSENIHSLINSILQYPPQNMHLILLTRRDPPLQLKTLRTNDRLTEFRMQDLSFSVEEIVALFRQNHALNLTEEIAKMIRDKTEGWIVGLRLASLAIKKPEHAEEILANISSDFFTSSDYLMEEVLENQPPELQKLLMFTSLCKRFCADLVDDLNKNGGDVSEGKLNGREFIQWLTDSNLFLISLDVDRDWFRYHHLFQELLNKQLKKRYTQPEIERAEQLIARWNETVGNIDEAIDHFLAAGNINAAAEIVEKHAHSEFLHNVFRVEGWLKKLPLGLKEQRPGLLLIYAWIAYRQLHMERVPPLLDKIDLLIGKESTDQQLLAEINFFHGNFLYWMGVAKDTDVCINMLKQALVQVEKMPVHVLSNIELLLNMALQKNGEKETLIPALEKQILTMGYSNGYRLAYTYGSLTFVNLLCGNLMQAKKIASQMQIFTTNIEAEYLRSWSNYMHALSNFQLFEMNEATNHIKLVIENRSSIDRRVVIDTMVAQALLLQFKGEDELATLSIDTLMKYANETNDLHILFVAQSAKIRLTILQGNYDSAFQWAETFTEQPVFVGLFFWLEVPWFTLAKVLIAKGTPESLKRAIRLIEDLLKLITSSNLDYQLVEINMLLAIALEKLGQSHKGLKHFEQSVLLGNLQGCIRPFIEAENSIVSLLESLREKGIALDFIDKIMTFRNQFATDRILVNTKKSKPFFTDASTINKGDVKVSLTEREKETLLLLSEGLRNKEIANKLYVSEGTIKKHVYNMGQKFDTSSRVDLMNKARSFGFLEQD